MDHGIPHVTDHVRYGSHKRIRYTVVCSHTNLFPSLSVHGQRGVLAVEVWQQLLAGASRCGAHTSHHPHVHVRVCAHYGSRERVRHLYEQTSTITSVKL